MNPNELILRYLHGEATDAEVAELDRLLACDPALRLKLIVETGIDAGLCEIARERASQPSAVVPRRSVWLSWRPLTAAAAGIVFGMFCTSVVFGFVLYGIMIFGLQQQHAIAENRSILIASCVLIYMILFGHGLPTKLSTHI